MLETTRERGQVFFVPPARLRRIFAVWVRGQIFFVPPVIGQIEHGYSLWAIAANLGCSVTTVEGRVLARGDGGRSALTAAAGGTKKT